MGGSRTCASICKKMANDIPERQQHEPSETDGNGINDIYDIVQSMKEYTVTRCTFEREPCLLICQRKC